MQHSLDFTEFKFKEGQFSRSSPINVRQLDFIIIVKYFQKFWYIFLECISKTEFDETKHISLSIRLLQSYNIFQCGQLRHIEKSSHSNSIHKYSNIKITTSPSKISELGTRNILRLRIFGSYSAKIINERIYIVNIGWL